MPLKNKVDSGNLHFRGKARVNVQGVKSLGDHYTWLCPGFDFYIVKEYHHFSKRKGTYFHTFNYFYSEKSSKRTK